MIQIKMTVVVEDAVRKYAVGIDLGGTKLAVGLISSSGEVIDSCKVFDHTTMADLEMLHYIGSLTQGLLQKNKMSVDNIEGAGITYPGHINFKKGETITTSNLKGFRNYPIAIELGKILKTEVLLDNDANAQAYAEYKYGAGRGFSDQIFLTVSTGIGGGIIINDRLYRGKTGSAGEFGHIIVETDSPFQCTCGNYGCLMTNACGMNLKNLYRACSEDGNLPEKKFDGLALNEGYNKKDKVCLEIAENCSKYLAIALYNIFQIFNPPLVIFGGGLMKLGDEFFQQIQDKFKVYAGSMLYETMEIRLTVTGDNSGILGIAALVFDELKQDTR